MISGAATESKNEQSDYNLILNLIESTVNGGDVETADFDEYLKREWSLFLEKKREIKLNMMCLDLDSKILSKLIMFNVVRNQIYAANGKDNVLRPE